MSYKLLALDFDGTLLPYGHRDGISDRVLAALHAARDAGVVLCAATGRSRTEAGPALERMRGVFHYAVFTTGAHVCRMPDETLFLRTLTQGEADAVVRLARSYPGLFLQAFIGDVPYCEEALLQEEHLRLALEAYASMMGKPLALTPSLEQLFAEQGPPSQFFLVARSVEQAAEISRATRALGVVGVTSSAEDNLEILPLGVSKSSGLSIVCKALGISPAEVMAIGDSANDADMLRFAGLGVAMGQAPEAIRSLADYVTAPVEEDGAALAIERFLLSKN